MEIAWISIKKYPSRVPEPLRSKSRGYSALIRWIGLGEAEVIDKGEGDE